MITEIDQPFACREGARMKTDATPMIVPTVLAIPNLMDLMIVACKQIISEIGPKYGYFEPNKIANSHEMADPMTILIIRLIFSSIVNFILFTYFPPERNI